MRLEMAMNPHPQPELRNHTLIVTVSSNDGRPVLDRRAYESLARTFHEAADNDEVRVVVLRGLAGCFCLGGDFSEFLDATKHQKLIAAVTDMFRTLATFPKPILACVDRPTAGSVRFGGVDVAALTARERRRVRRELVGYVFQRPADNPLMGVPPGAVDNRHPFLPGWGSLPHRGTWHTGGPGTGR